MSKKHLKAGEPCPPLAKDCYRIISMEYCPFAQRPRLVAVHRQVNFDVVNVSLIEKPKWLFAANPFGTVPVLQFNDQNLFESLVVSDFLDEVTPGDKLHPGDPYEKAKLQVIVAQVSRIRTPYDILVYTTDTEKHVEAKEALFKAFDFFEDNLKCLYYGGDKVGMTDYMVWPWIERMPVVQEVAGLDPLPKERFPKLNAWIEAMKTTPGVKATITPLETHLKNRTNALKRTGVYDY